MGEIRDVGVDEWRTVRQVRLAALTDTPDWFWSTFEEEVDQPEKWWRGFVEAGTWFIAFQDGQPIGIAAAIGDADLEATERQLISMWVAPEARNRGIGTSLIERVKVQARAARIRELQLDVTENNESARRLYERCGFKATGRTQVLRRKPSLVEHEMRLRL